MPGAHAIAQKLPGPCHSSSSGYQVSENALSFPQCQPSQRQWGPVGTLSLGDAIHPDLSMASCQQPWELHSLLSLLSSACPRCLQTTDMGIAEPTQG